MSIPGPMKRVREESIVFQENLDTLNSDSLIQILNYLPVKGIMRCSLANRTVYQITQNRDLWKWLLERDFFILHHNPKNSAKEVYQDEYMYRSNLAKGFCATYAVDFDEDLNENDRVNTFQCCVNGKLFGFHPSVGLPNSSEVVTWDLKSLKRLGCFAKPEFSIKNCVASDGKMLILSIDRTTIAIYDLESKVHLRTINFLSVLDHFAAYDGEHSLKIVTVTAWHNKLYVGINLNDGTTNHNSILVFDIKEDKLTELIKLDLGQSAIYHLEATTDKLLIVIVFREENKIKLNLLTRSLNVDPLPDSNSSIQFDEMKLLPIEKTIPEAYAEEMDDYDFFEMGEIACDDHLLFIRRAQSFSVIDWRKNECSKIAEFSVSLCNWVKKTDKSGKLYFPLYAVDPIHNKALVTCDYKAKDKNIYKSIALHLKEATTFSEFSTVLQQFLKIPNSTIKAIYINASKISQSVSPETIEQQVKQIIDRINKEKIGLQFFRMIDRFNKYSALLDLERRFVNEEPIENSIEQEKNKIFEAVKAESETYSTLQVDVAKMKNLISAAILEYVNGLEQEEKQVAEEKRKVEEVDSWFI